MEYLYNIGDKIRIKENFTKIRFENDAGIDPNMIKMAGQRFVIRDAQTYCDHAEYHLELDEDYTMYEYHDKMVNCFIWSEEWLEPYFEDQIIVISENNFTEDFEELFK